MRVPDLALLAEPTLAPTVREVAERWQASRVDLSEHTRIQHRSSLNVMLPLIGDRRLDDFAASDVADLVAELSKTRKNETVRKMIVHLAMVFDSEGVSPNPARGATLPWEQKREIQPRPPSRSKRCTGCCRRATSCRCSCWTRRGCGSASSRG